MAPLISSEEALYVAHPAYDGAYNAAFEVAYYAAGSARARDATAHATSTAHKAAIKAVHHAVCAARKAAHIAARKAARIPARIAAEAEHLRKVSRAATSATAEIALKVLVQEALLDKRTAYKAARIVVAQAWVLYHWWEKIIEQSTRIEGEWTSRCVEKVHWTTYLERKNTVESAARIALDVLQKSQDNFRALLMLAKDSSRAVSKAPLAPPTSTLQTLRCWYNSCDESNEDVYKWLTTDKEWGDYPTFDTLCWYYMYGHYD